MEIIQCHSSAARVCVCVCRPVMTSQRDASSDVIGHGSQTIEAVLAFQAQILIKL